MGSTFVGKTVLVTGANRGLGQAFVEEALRRGAKRVYAGTRQPFSHPDERVIPVLLDVTDQAQIQAAGEVESLDLLINNAGRVGPRRLERSFRIRAAPGGEPVRDLGRHAGVPAVADAQPRSRGQCRIARAVAAVPVLPAYSVSKAASLSLTQSLRALLAGRGVTFTPSCRVRSIPTWSGI